MVDLRSKQHELAIPSRLQRFCAETQLTRDIYDANTELLIMDGAEKAAEREARLRRTIGERIALMNDIAHAVICDVTELKLGTPVHINTRNIDGVITHFNPVFKNRVRVSWFNRRLLRVEHLWIDRDALSFCS